MCAWLQFGGALSSLGMKVNEQLSSGKTPCPALANFSVLAAI
jgi:hypothetical protein